MSEIPPAPTQTQLREAALAHLARFATTRQGLRLVLQRRIRRWAGRAVRAGLEEEQAVAHEQQCQPWIDEIVASMEGLGAVDDAGYARARARSMTRTGRSRRAVKAHLRTKGVEQDTLDQAIDESLGERSDESGREAELGAALVLARKRCVGPFARPDRPEKEHHKVLAIFARNGFSQDVAQSALAMDLDEAEERIFAFRSL